MPAGEQPWLALGYLAIQGLPASGSTPPRGGWTAKSHMWTDILPHVPTVSETGQVRRHGTSSILGTDWLRSPQNVDWVQRSLAATVILGTPATQPQSLLLGFHLRQLSPSEEVPSADSYDSHKTLRTAEDKHHS